MIGRIAGVLAAKNPPQILVDVHGVGYEIDVPMSSFYDLPELGKPVVILTHFVVREDAQLLYGFLTESERAAFRALIKVTGIGPRIALAVLSGLSVTDLQRAISLQEVGLLTRVPGIGKKTAERLILELKDKLGTPIGTVADRPIKGVSISSMRCSHWATRSVKPSRQPKAWTQGCPFQMALSRH